MESKQSENIRLVQRFYELYSAGDTQGMHEVLAEDITWAIPGHHPLAGIKRGVDEIVAYFEQLKKAGFKAELQYLGGDEHYVVDVHRGWSNYGTADVDMRWVLVYRIENHKIKEVQNFAADQHAADMLFWTVFGNDLKPLPERLK